MLQHPYCLCFVKLRVVGTSSAPHCLNKKQLEKVWVWTIWAILLANYSIALLNIPLRAGTHLLSLSWALNVKTCISMSSLRPLQFQAYWFWPAQNQGRLGLLWWGNMGHSSLHYSCDFLALQRLTFSAILNYAITPYNYSR